MPTARKQEHNQEIAVRLEGGIGDHVLGLRLLPYVRAAHPDERIIVYSDAAGSETQRDVAQMSPFVNEVRMIGPRPDGVSLATMGDISTLPDNDRHRIEQSAAFYDAWGGDYFMHAAHSLDIPVFQILATVPELHVPPAAQTWADKLLANQGECKFVALHLAKYGAENLHIVLEPVRRILAAIGTRSDVRILNLFSRRFGYNHWPDDVRANREANQEREADMLTQLSESDERIHALPDLDILQLAAVLRRSCYFIGVDNGIRHLAWALGLPSSVVMPQRPDPQFSLRWCQDYHRVVTPDESAGNIARHSSELARQLAEPVSTENREQV